MILTDILHGFFSLLGQSEGKLLMSVVGLILYVVIDYMVISEWSRTRHSEHKFLAIAFSSLAIQNLIAVVFMAALVFAETPSYLWELSLMDNFFTIFALFVVANAFVYPVMLKKKIGAPRFMAQQFILLVIVGGVLSVFTLSILDLLGGEVLSFWSHTVLYVFEVALLVYYSGYMLVNLTDEIKYQENIIVALMTHAISPVIGIFNILLYNGTNASLDVAAMPFPLLSVLMFMRIVYLKLADKVSLFERLKRSERLYQKEKEISKLKDEFVSTVSHELKTPLTSMKLYLSLLRDGKLGKVNGKQKNALVVVNEESDRLNGLITDLLDLSRLKSGRSKIVLSEFDFHKVAHDKLLLNLARERHGLNVVVDVPKNFYVVADEDKIKQVFVNLVSNAMKFTSRGGRISIWARRETDSWLFTVADTGCGVDKTKVPYLFKKFYQVEDVMTRTKGGVGLGLAIVKSIVDMHKGNIQIDTKKGKGTMFTIRIPNLNMY